MNLTYSTNILYEKVNRLKELVCFLLFVHVHLYIFENVILVSYIIYLHGASLTYFFQQSSILAL